MKHKILFVDRDGTLIDEPSIDFQVDSISKLVFKRNVISSLSNLIKLNYKLVMVTNQDGLGSNNFKWEDFNLPHNFMLSIFRSEKIIFEDILICSHFEKEKCKCRKPQIKMLKPWIKDDLIDRKHSYVIGDRIVDMELAKNIGVLGIQYQDDICNWSKIEKIITKRNRYAETIRETKETKVHVKIWMDLEEVSTIDTGVNFFNHMLDQLSIHSGICMNIKTIGDLKIDDHHTVEDTGIVLGKTLLKALGDKKGLNRFGFSLPMDESRSDCIIDISGRPYFKFNAHFNHKMIGDLSTEMIEHFFYSLCYSMNITLHLSSKGKNDHHCAESLFKAFGRALRQSIQIIGQVLPTSKGIL
ncbi:bifunctional histidinol-phosphatase/imidazoleglycerol-phosphate dehydratase HisB [Buchnera aphidicola (Muscaphis stroyani)]|uniref:Histidine biosynthesis bifunctional protein HisB n=1 Tax=Buchnera aphidicola (Muscaphis stroyani) TaxID=1241869 RepID=A0A4D6Y3M3_9GAMM|nr:bifunctional histidinol-phosphatase/imidazoleglycerol-phosphate dehydratase HisB [Buchnera aphidicola]QCI24206.1 bifunctional histidinol-phosphatase/imidazoleglycerol-phosphate dehydratase HisB [Buchnera aphidicola (Muscaphis stroyani)]